METNLTQVVKGVTMSKVCNLKADSGSTEVKQITVQVSFDGVTLNDVFEKAMSSTVIAWQNSNRRNFDSLKNGQIAEISFKAPGRGGNNPMIALIAEAKAAGVDTNDIDALLEFISKKAEALVG